MTRARTAGARRTWNWPIWTLTAILAAGLIAGTVPAAEAAKSKAAAKNADAGAEVDRTIETGVSALEAGKPELAVQELTSAITGGKISQPRLAQALYYRGLAYRKQSKPAQAIADFTSALWIKNGLDPQQRADALANRAGAYRDAGLTEQAEADEQRVAAAAATKGQSTRAAPTASRTETAPAPSTSSGGLGGFFSALFGSEPTPQQPASQSAPEANGRQAARSAPAASVSAWSTEASPAAGSSTAQSRPRAAAPRTAGWSDSTVVKSDSAVVEKVNNRQAAATPVTTGSTGGSMGAAATYVQVAAVRSRNEAQAVATRLTQLGAAQTGKREAAIEEAVMGNMGTLYRVRLGPFASSKEVDSVCTRLRDAGLDCLVLGR
jgi:tetratricopeptide (TPR) repeat protein